MHIRDLALKISYPSSPLQTLLTPVFLQTLFDHYDPTNDNYIQQMTMLPNKQLHPLPALHCGIINHILARYLSPKTIFHQISSTPLHLLYYNFGEKSLCKER